MNDIVESSPLNAPESEAEAKPGDVRLCTLGQEEDVLRASLRYSDRLWVF